MAETVTLNCQIREEQGRAYVRDLRKAGFVPGVFYKGGEEAVALKFDARDITKFLKNRPPLFKVRWGDGESQEFECVLRDVQYHPVSQKVIHLDLMGITRGVKIYATVPVRVVGDPVGVKEGGILNVAMSEADIRSLPKDIPEVVEADVSELNIGDAVHLGDIEMEGVEWVTSPERTIAAVVAPKMVAEEEKEGLEGEEGEEGEGAEEEEGAGEGESEE